MTGERVVELLESVAQDFGRIRSGSPLGIVRPRSADEVVAAVSEAVSAGQRLTPRGLGHSAGGQALPADSMTLDLSRMDSVGPVDVAGRLVWCDAGALLRDVVAATLEHGLLPRVLTNLLDLTVGGVLSVGGVGPGSHRHGTFAANVASMDVVTGDGALTRCSRTTHRDLYDAVLGGLGRCGVIVAAELELRPVRQRVRTFYLLYDDVDRWLGDQRNLTRRPDVECVEGLCSASPQGLRGAGGRRVGFAEWFFPVQVSIEYDTTPPELPPGLAPYRVVHVEDDEIRYFPTRHDMRFEMIKRIGAWDAPHPYVSAFIDVSALGRILPAVLEQLPLALGDTHRGLFLLAADREPPFVAVPASEDVAFFNVIHANIPAALLQDALVALQGVSEALIGAGGKRYVADWLGDMDDDDWRRHFGPVHKSWARAKERFDPGHVFCSALIP